VEKNLCHARTAGERRWFGDKTSTIHRVCGQRKLYSQVRSAFRSTIEAALTFQKLKWPQPCIERVYRHADVNAVARPNEWISRREVIHGRSVCGISERHEYDGGAKPHHEGWFRYALVTPIPAHQRMRALRQDTRQGLADPQGTDGVSVNRYYRIATLRWEGGLLGPSV
jgi:hypothetical protein